MLDLRRLPRRANALTVREGCRDCRRSQIRGMPHRHVASRGYTAAARYIFARQLAVEMWRRGESRSVTTGEIPAVLFEPFLGPGRPLDAARRDLIAACFLERKPPNILFVPHKSFLEYLVAEHIVERLRNTSGEAEAGIDFEITRLR
jgi:hypothetical protein